MKKLLVLLLIISCSKPESNAPKQHDVKYIIEGTHEVSAIQYPGKGGLSTKHDLDTLPFVFEEKYVYIDHISIHISHNLGRDLSKTVSIKIFVDSKLVLHRTEWIEDVHHSSSGHNNSFSVHYDIKEGKEIIYDKR